MENKELIMYLSYRAKDGEIISQLDIRNPTVIPIIGDFLNDKNNNKFVVQKRTIRYNSHLDYLFIDAVCND